LCIYFLIKYKRSGSGMIFYVYFLLINSGYIFQIYCRNSFKRSFENGQKPVCSQRSRISEKLWEIGVGQRPRSDSANYGQRPDLQRNSGILSGQRPAVTLPRATKFWPKVQWPKAKIRNEALIPMWWTNSVHFYKYLM